MCGINGVGMYTNMIFIEAGFEGDQATTASTIVYIVQLVVAFVGVSMKLRLLYKDEIAFTHAIACCKSLKMLIIKQSTV